MSLRRSIAVAVAIAMIFLHGCAIERPLKISNLKAIPCINVVRYKSPQLKKITLTSKVIIGVGFVAAGAFGGGAAGGIAEKMAIDGGVEMMRKSTLPDFGKLMTDKFVQRVSTEIPGFPPLQLVEEPVGEDFAPEAEYLIVLRVYFLQVDDSGFSVWISAKMTDPSGLMPWLRDYVYKSKDFNRAHTLAEYEAGDGSIFKEEYYFALDNVVSELVRSLKGSKS
jgi:hypothetical protein